MKETKETGQLNPAWHPGLDPGTNKAIGITTHEIRINSVLSFKDHETNSSSSYLFHLPFPFLRNSVLKVVWERARQASTGKAGRELH